MFSDGPDVPAEEVADDRGSRRIIRASSRFAGPFHQLTSFRHRISAEGLGINGPSKSRISRGYSPTISLLGGQNSVGEFQAGLKSPEVREHRLEDGGESSANFVNRER